MNGRWRVRRRTDAAWRGSPWLVLRSREWEATQWNGPVLALGAGAARELGPDLLAAATSYGCASSPGSAGATSHGSSARRSSISGSSRGSGTCGSPRRSGTGVSPPGRRLSDVSDDELRDTLDWARAAMLESVDGRRPSRAVYRRAGRGCPRCGRRGAIARAGRRQSHGVLVPELPAVERISGEGGIRTLDERITTRNALAGRRLQPLGHLSRVAQDIGRSGRLPKPAAGDAATLSLLRRGAGAVERGGLENR